MTAKNICIAFLGFDNDRIYRPFTMLNCNKIYIIRRPRRVEHKTATWNYEQIRKNLPRQAISCIEAEHDVFLRINCVKKIFEQEKENRLFVNVSTGSKLDAIAGMLSVMMFGDIPREAVPFYAHPDDTGRGKHPWKFSETKGVSSIDEIPVLELQKPDSAMQSAIRIIAENDGRVRKKELVTALCAGGNIEGYPSIDKPKTRYDPDGQKVRSYQTGALHAAENRIFRHLKTKWKAIDEEEKSKNRTIKLSSNGRMLAKIFLGDRNKKNSSVF